MSKSMRERILQLIVDSENEFHRPAGRQWLSQNANVKMSVIDEHVKGLKTDGLIFASSPGYFKPVPDFPADRAVTVTVLTNGMRKLEFGDEYAEFTPHEWATIGSLAHGSYQALAQRQGDEDVLGTLQRQKAQIRELTRQLADMTVRIARLQRAGQPDLFEAKPVPA